MPFNVCGSMDLNTELASAWVIFAWGRTGKIADFKVQSLRRPAQNPTGALLPDHLPALAEKVRERLRSKTVRYMLPVTWRLDAHPRFLVRSCSPIFRKPSSRF